MPRSLWSYALRISATLLIFAILFSRVDASRLGDVLTTIDPSALLFLLALATADRWLMAYKWAYLLKTRGIRLSYFLAFKVYCFALAIGLFVPTSVGADVIRWYALRRRGIPSEPVATSIVVERAIGLIATVVVAGAAVLWMVREGYQIPRLSTSVSPSLVATWVLVALVFLGPIAWWGLRVHRPDWGKRIGDKVTRATQAVAEYATAPGILAKFSLLTVLEQFVPITMAVGLAAFLDLGDYAVYMAAAVPVAYLVSRLPVSLGGIGVFEAVFVALTVQSGMAAADSLAIALMMRLAHICAWLPWWWLYTAETRRR